MQIISYYFTIYCYVNLNIMIKLKRIYQESQPEDGFRILVDRLWPRGVSKEKANLDLWLKNVAPSDELRKWFNHDISKWEEFKSRYKDELLKNSAFNQLKYIIKKQNRVTILFATRDELHNQAVVLKELLDI